MLVKTFQKWSSSWAVAFFGIAVFSGVSLGLLVNRLEPLYVAAIVLGLIVLGATIASVEAGLLVLIFLTYTRFSDIAVHYHGAPSIAKGFIFLMILAIGIRWIIYGEKPKGWLKPAVLLGIYGLVGFASSIIADHPDRVQETLVDFLKDSIIAVLIVILLQRASQMRKVVWALLCAGIFLGTISVFQYLTKTFSNNYWGFAQAGWMNIINDTEGYRLSGPLGDPNFYAQIMVVLVPLALERMINERRATLRLLAGWAGLVCAATVIFTMSRGGFLALVVMMVPLVMILPNRALTLPLVASLGIVLIALLPARYIDRILTLQDILPTSSNSLRTEDYSLRGRASENLAAWEMFRENPILGVGWGNYPSHYLKYAQQIGLASQVEERAAHNLYLEVAAETGLLGLGSFGLILLVMARGIWKARGEFNNWKGRHPFFKASKDCMRGQAEKEWSGMVNAFGIGMLGYLAAAFFVHAAYPRYFWLLAGIALALPQISLSRLVGEQPAGVRNVLPDGTETVSQTRIKGK